jgi:hypothetical protein
MVFGNGNEKGTGTRIENHENETSQVEETRLGSSLIIARMTLFASPFWLAHKPHNNRRLK